MNLIRGIHMSILVLILNFNQDKKNFEDAKVVIGIRKSKKDRQHNDQKKKGQKDKQ